MYRIFKKDSKGKIRFLHIDTDGDKVVQTSGITGGKAVVNISQCEPKNIGKSNETSAEDQALSIANAKFVKKLKEGYFRTQEEAIDEVVILPMLAKVFEKEEHKIVYPCFAQPKLDGMRGLGNHSAKTLMSRSGNKIETLQHIVDALPVTLGTLDGELYAHGKSFQENMKMIKKYRPGQTELVKYHVYDFITTKPMNFFERKIRLTELCKDIPDIVIVDTIIVNNKKELMEFHSANISKGFEGTMVRWGDEPYKLNGRSSGLLKLKDFHDLALPLLGVEPSEKRPTHGKPYFYWKGAMNHRMGPNILGAGLSISHEEAEDLLANKAEHIGKVCELRFFEYSDEGVPRHPVMHGFRLDK
jgi:ATP-dependent DNA ligase